MNMDQFGSSTFCARSTIDSKEAWSGVHNKWSQSVSHISSYEVLGYYRSNLVWWEEPRAVTFETFISRD